MTWVIYRTAPRGGPDGAAASAPPRSHACSSGLENRVAGRLCRLDWYRRGEKALTPRADRPQRRLQPPFFQLPDRLCEVERWSIELTAGRLLDVPRHDIRGSGIGRTFQHPGCSQHHARARQRDWSAPTSGSAAVLADALRNPTWCRRAPGAGARPCHLIERSRPRAGRAPAGRRAAVPGQVSVGRSRSRPSSVIVSCVAVDPTPKAALVAARRASPRAQPR